MIITKLYSSEGWRHGEAELEVLGTERSEAGNEKEEGGREQVSIKNVVLVKTSLASDLYSTAVLAYVNCE